MVLNSVPSRLKNKSLLRHLWVNLGRSKSKQNRFHLHLNDLTRIPFIVENPKFERLICTQVEYFVILVDKHSAVTHFWWPWLERLRIFCDARMT